MFNGTSTQIGQCVTILLKEVFYVGTIDLIHLIQILGLYVVRRAVSISSAVRRYSLPRRDSIQLTITPQ